jgi:cell division protease FtsH
MFLPEEDRYSHSRRFIVSQICSLFGGRIAEEMTLGKDGVTTGASNDIQRATDIARKMVTKWGLSDKMGPLMYDEATEEVFLGRSAGQPHLAVSADTAKQIDEEVRRIIDECYAIAQNILQDNVEKLHVMSQALMLYETIDADQIDDIMAGRQPREPKDWGGTGGNTTPDADLGAASPDASGRPIGGPAGEH